MKVDLHELYRYCRDHISMFKEKEAIALEKIDKYSCPLQMASDLYDEMFEAIADWCEDNDTDLDSDDIDIEEVFWAGEGEGEV